MTFLGVMDRLIVPALIIFLFIGSVAGIALGCGLLLRAAGTLKFLRGMNRWVSTRRAIKPLEIPREAMQPSKWLGLFLVAGGAFACYFLLARLEIPRSALTVASPKFLAALALETTRWLLAVGSVLAIVMGALVLFSPRGLNALELRMNRWHSTRRLLPANSDEMRVPLDLLVETYPYRSGWIIALSSLLVAAAMGMLIVVRWLP